jgi:hypothetical protein
MFTITEKIEKKYKIIVAAFFLLFLIIGLFVLRDYGISTDETVQVNLGQKALNLILNGDSSFFNVSNKFHGTAFTLIGSSIDSMFKLTEINLVYLARHIWTFLLFYFSVICFYFLCKNIFKDWKIAILGSIFLVLSPRILSHSFFNPKDVPFLSVFIISMYTLLLFLQKKTAYNGLIHGIACAFLIGIRILGVLVPVLTFCFFVMDFLISRKEINRQEFKRRIFNFLVFVLSLIVFLMVFLPILWQDPLKNFVSALTIMSKYPWDGCMIYMGGPVDSHNLPWHYIPFYVIATTPIFYSVLFLFGLGFFISKIRLSSIFYNEEKYKILAVLWLFLPVASVIILKSTLYGAWRQMYFIYPAFLILSLNGISFFIKLIKNKSLIKYKKSVVIVLVSIVAINLIYILSFFIRNHPYENVYFNILAGKNMEVVKQRFDLDTWGLSYKSGLDYILKNDDRSTIKILVLSPGPNNKTELYLPVKDRERLEFVDYLDGADYFLTNFRCQKVIESAQKNVYFEALVNGTSIMTVYKLN